METKPVILEEKEIPMHELKSELSNIKKRDEELNFRTQKTDEYINIFSNIKLADAKALRKDVTELNIPRIKDIHIIKIIDLLPTTVEEVKLILQGYTITVTQDNMKKIADVVKKYA